MAITDQGDFSSVSWSNEVTLAGQGFSSLLPEPVARFEPHPNGSSNSRLKNRGSSGVDMDSHNHTNDMEPGHTGDILECFVSEPRKENDGTKDAYVSYLITTNTTFSTFQKPATQIRRRFTDFVFLYKTLTREYQASAVPPIPDKQRMEYVRGDRFGPDFTNRRAHSLQRFISRLALHPELRRAPILHQFLESPDWNATMRSHAARSPGTAGDVLHSPGLAGAGGALIAPAPGGGGGVFDSFADSFMNAFTKVHKPDRRFVEVKEKSDKLDEDLSHVEKVVNRVARREADIETDLRDLAEQFQKLITLEPGVSQPAQAFAASVEDTSQGLRRLKEHKDADYLSSLRDMTAYSGALKNLLKACEQKQLDFEQLTEYLNRATADRDTLNSGYPDRSGPLGSTGSFIRSKIEDVRGVDHEQSRRDRLRKLELRIDELSREVEMTKQEADNFADHVVKEVGYFEWIKRVEFKRQLTGLANAHLEFYDSVVNVWEKFVQEMEREGFVLPS